MDKCVLLVFVYLQAFLLIRAFCDAATLAADDHRQSSDLVKRGSSTVDLSWRGCHGRPGACAAFMVESPPLAQISTLPKKIGSYRHVGPRPLRRSPLSKEIGSYRHVGPCPLRRSPLSKEIGSYRRRAHKIGRHRSQLSEEIGDKTASGSFISSNIIYK